MITLAVGQMAVRVDVRSKGRRLLSLMASVMAIEMAHNGWRENPFKERISGPSGELDIQLKRESFDLIYFLDQYSAPSGHWRFSNLFS